MQIIAGPCSVESHQQMHNVVTELIDTVDMIRCGVWKPRTHPGGFEGLGMAALKIVQDIKKEFPYARFCCEVANPQHVELALLHGIDAVWIGARTTSNPFSVSEIASALHGTHTSVMVKNATAPDIELWLGAIERIEQSNVESVSAIHRGFTAYHNTIYRNDPLWEVAIELHRRRTDLPLICDPSHITGRADKVAELSQTALDLGFDGLMIEVHPTPSQALTDATQQITPHELNSLLHSLVQHTNSSTPQRLQMLRTEIDEVDKQLMQILSRRMNICREIATVKKEHNLTVLQSNRWEQVLQDKITMADRLGIDGDFVRRLYESIHTESLRIQIEEERK